MIEKIKALAKIKLAQNDDAHGYDHAIRVANLAEEIRKKEGGDQFIILVSCYLHDWCSSKGREYHVSEKALQEIKADMEKLNIPADKIKTILEIIKHHEDYNFKKKKIRLSKECLILQDADRLDSLGAIGIGRVFYTTAKLNEPFGTPDEMEKLKEDYHVGQITSAIRHFYTKLLNLKDSMNTPSARALAEKRHQFMVEFLNRIKLEWSGKI